jgi:AcrR family transcriptional regulator
MSTSGSDYGDPNTRRLILAAAWDLIEEGDIAVRLADVGARAGVSRRTIYLHFGDRAGLLAALVDHMDESIDARSVADPIWSAPSTSERLAAVVAFYSYVNPRVDSVARVLESRPEDVAARAAWRSRMEMRRRFHRDVLMMISDQGDLAPGWTVDTAADLLHALMLPAVWRELVDEIDWSIDDCRAHLTTVLQRTFSESPT